MENYHWYHVYLSTTHAGRFARRVDLFSTQMYRPQNFLHRFCMPLNWGPHRRPPAPGPGLYIHIWIWTTPRYTDTPRDYIYLSAFSSYSTCDIIHGYLGCAPSMGAHTCRTSKVIHNREQPTDTIGRAKTLLNTRPSSYSSRQQPSRQLKTCIGNPNPTVHCTNSHQNGSKWFPRPMFFCKNPSETLRTS